MEMKIKNRMKVNWKTKKLGEICNFVGGGTPSKNNPDFWNGDISWASIKDIKGQYLTKTSDFITDEGLKKSATNLANPNEIILATRINPGRPIITKIQTSINQDLKIVRPKIEIDSAFLYYLFLNIENDIIKLSNGTTVLGITLNSLNDIDIQLPSSQTQQSIVSKIEELFSELDKGIEDLKTAQQQLKTYRQSVLKWAFEGKLTNYNLKDGELPKGWEIKTLKELTLKVEKVKRKEVDDREEIIYLDIGGLDNNFNKIENYKTYKWKDAPSRAQQIVKLNDVLFSTVRTYMKNIAIVDKEIFYNQIASSGFTVLRANEKTNFKYIFYNTISDIFLNPLNELQTGSSYPAVRDSDVYNQKISIPLSLEEQHRIVQEIESRLSVADKMEESITQSLQQAEALRQSILKKAFSGELV